jgi:hypothetical protein
MNFIPLHHQLHPSPSSTSSLKEGAVIIDDNTCRCSEVA